MKNKIQNVVGRLFEPELKAGLLAGGIGLVVSFAGRGIILGRVLGDPLPLVLAPTQLMRTRLYFNWQAPLWHFLFAVGLGALSVVLLKFLPGKRPFPFNAPLITARIAAAINILVVVLLQVDAVVVALYYAIAGFISISISSFVAGKIGAKMSL